jgi:hypothetical protein
MKDKKRLIKIVLSIVSTVIILAFLMIVINSVYKKANSSNKKYQEKIELINSSYNQFSLLIEGFNSKREKLGEYMNNTVYYEDLYLIKDELYKFYEEYDEIVGSLSTVAESLKLNCKNKLTDEDANKKCDSYKEAYEMVIDIYLTDIDMYNEKAIKYNELKKDEPAQIFESKYVIVDNDKQSSGKEV